MVSLGYDRHEKKDKESERWKKEERELWVGMGYVHMGLTISAAIPMKGVFLQLGKTCRGNEAQSEVFGVHRATHRTGRLAELHGITK
jgi:hypothetical protein